MPPIPPTTIRLPPTDRAGLAKIAARHGMETGKIGSASISETVRRLIREELRRMGQEEQEER